MASRPPSACEGAVSAQDADTSPAALGRKPTPPLHFFSTFQNTVGPAEMNPVTFLRAAETRRHSPR
jgi:hypothetical protein